MKIHPAQILSPRAAHVLVAATFACLSPLALGLSPSPQDQVKSVQIHPKDGDLDLFLELDKAVGELFFAIEIGNDGRAVELIRGGADLSLKFGGESPMDAAVRRGQLTVLRALVEAGMPATLSSGEAVAESDLLLPGQRDPQVSRQSPPAGTASRLHSALIQAVLMGETERVTALLKDGADVNAAGPDGLSALHCAAAGGSGAIVRLLLEAGASKDLRAGPDNRTSLELALSSRGNDATVAALIAGGVALDPNQATSDGTTLLHLASSSGYLHIMRELIGDAASTNAKSFRTDERKDLVDTPVMGAVKNDETDAVVMLIRRGADLNVKDYQGGTPLWYAPGKHDGLTTRMLITGGSDPNLAGLDGEAPLLEAARTGKEEKLRVLLEMGANPNATHKGNTALHHVASGGTWEMATWLLEAGAVSGLTNNEDLSALDVALSNNNHLVAHTLVPRESDSLLLAIASNDLGAMRQALQLGSNPTLGLSDGSTPLHQFARQGEKGFEAAKLFLVAGANPNALDLDGNSPLSELINEKAHRSFIKLLMDAGAEPGMGSNNAAMLAQRMGDRSLMGLLSERPGIPSIAIITRSGFPHPAAQASRACELYAGMPDYESALAQINLAVHSKPTNGRYRLYRAKLRGVTGDVEGALEDYSRILKERPSWMDPKVDYGVMLVQNGHNEEGLMHLDQVMVRLQGRTDPKLHLHRGRARAALGNLTGALEDLELALQTDPDSGLVMMHLGIAQKMSGDLDAACKSWRDAVAAGEKDASALIEKHCK